MLTFIYGCYILVKSRVTSNKTPTDKRIWRGIEVVITRRSWKPFVRKGAWVRIPPSPLHGALPWGYIWKYGRSFGEVLKWLKRHPWKGCRSLIAARGFKSLLLREERQSFFKMNLDNWTAMQPWIYSKSSAKADAGNDTLSRDREEK